MKQILCILFALPLLAQPPAPRPKPTQVKVGSTTEAARTIEFVPGTGTTYSLSCADGTCSVTINYTGNAPDVVDYTGASRTAPVKAGTTPPGTCTVGDWFFDTDAAPGRNIALCTAANTWTYLEATYATIDNTVLTLPRITSYTVGTLPAAGTAGRLAVVTDSSNGTCSSGGGGQVVLCRDSGTAWIAIAGGSGGGGDAVQGATNLTTSGSLPLVVSSGTLGQSQLSCTGGTCTLDGASGSASLQVREGAGQKDVATPGPNLVQNGTFDSDLSYWTATGWTWSSGAAAHTPGNTNQLSQNIAVTAGMPLILSFTISGRTAGNVTPRIGTTGFAAKDAYQVAPIASNGTFSYYYVVPSTTGTVSFNFLPSSDFNGAIDNVVVQSLSVPDDHFRLTSSDGTIYWRFTPKGNILIGRDAGLWRAINNSSIIAIGDNAAKNVVSSDNIIAIGSNALSGNLYGARLIAVGNNTNITSPNNSVVIGHSASSEYYDTVLGDGASSTGNRSVVIGRSASSASTQSVVIGDAAASTNATATGNIVIGRFVQASCASCGVMGRPGIKWAFGGETNPQYTMHIRDTTATTGVTTLAVQEGAGQGTTAPIRVLNSAGTSVFAVPAGGLSGTGNAYVCVDANGNLYRSATACM